MSLFEDIEEEDDAVLTVKSHLRSRKLARSVRSVDLWYDHPGPLTILLIHGFMTDEDSAWANYRKLKLGLARIDPALSGSALTFSWPSMGDWRDHVNFFRNKDEVARAAGALLGAAIKRDMIRQQRPRDYVLIAHSLGSRVVMETLAALDAEGADWTGRLRIVLMAAALPIEDFEPGSRYAALLAKARNSDVLYSEQDTVLRDVFRPGMLWTTKQAVGLKGRPDQIWWNREQMTGFKHGDYWQDREARVSGYIAKRLGIANPAPLPTDTLPQADDLDSARLGAM